MAIIDDIPTELIQKVSEDFDEGLIQALTGGCWSWMVSETSNAVRIGLGMLPIVFGPVCGSRWTMSCYSWAESRDPASARAPGAVLQIPYLS